MSRVTSERPDHDSNVGEDHDSADGNGLPSSEPADGTDRDQGTLSSKRGDLARLNAGAYRLAIPVGVAVGILLWAVVRRWSTESDAFVFGETVAVGAAAGLLVALLAHVSRFRWRWWFYPPVIASIAGLIVGLMALTGSPTSSGPSTTRAAELAVPASFETLPRIDPELVERARVTAEATVKRQVEGVEALVMGQYAEPGKAPSVAFVGINVVPGSQADDDITESPDEAVLNYLAGAGVRARKALPPGPLGGAMMCGWITVESGHGYTCAWATSGVIGVVTFVGGITGFDHAAKRTREFRALAEHVR